MGDVPLPPWESCSHEHLASVSCTCCDTLQAGDLHFYMRHSFVTPEDQADHASGCPVTATTGTTSAAVSKPAHAAAVAQTRVNGCTTSQGLHTGNSSFSAGASKQAGVAGKPLQQQELQASSALNQHVSPAPRASTPSPNGAAVVLNPAPSFALAPTLPPNPARLDPLALPLPETALGAAPPRHATLPAAPGGPGPAAAQQLTQDVSSETGEEDTVSQASSPTPITGAWRSGNELRAAASSSQFWHHQQVQQAGSHEGTHQYPTTASATNAPRAHASAAAAESGDGHHVAGASPHNSPPRPSSASAAVSQWRHMAEQHTHSSPAPSNTTPPPPAGPSTASVPTLAAGSRPGGGGPLLSRHSSFSRRSSSNQIAVPPGGGAGVVGGSSDDESESGYSTRSGKSARRLNR